MDFLARYIQTGKQIGFRQLLKIFGLTAVLIAAVFGILCSYLMHQETIQQIIRDIPVIRVENGSVVQPVDTLWRKELSDVGISLLLNTTDQPSDLPERGNILYIEKSDYGVVINGQHEKYPLPQEAVTLDHEYINKILKQGILRMSVFVGLIILMTLGIGYAGVYAFSLLFLWLIQKKVPHAPVRRSALIGWVSVLILDIVLVLFGFGFGFHPAVAIATVISVFSVLKSGETT